jgi:hypothetical protein
MAENPLNAIKKYSAQVLCRVSSINSSEPIALQIIATTKAGFFSNLTVILNQNGYETADPTKYAINHRAAASSS